MWSFYFITVKRSRLTLPQLFSLKTDCRQNISGDAAWLETNLGPFSTVADYSDLKALNISMVKCMSSVMFLLSHTRA